MTAFASYRDRSTLAKSEAVRIASLLGLKSAGAMDDVTLAERVASGIEVEAAYALKEMVEPLGPKAFYEIVSEPTLRRAGPRRTLTRGPSERVYEIGRVLDRVATIFRGDTDRIVRFMTRPNPVLKGHTPFAMASSSSAGANAVIRLLDEAEAGLGPLMMSSRTVRRQAVSRDPGTRMRLTARNASYGMRDQRLYGRGPSSPPIRASSAAGSSGMRGGAVRHISATSSGVRP